MKNPILTLLLLAMALLFLNGCQPPDTDVTKDPGYYFSSFAGTVYRTRTRTALTKMKLYTGKWVIGFDPAGVFDPTNMQSGAMQSAIHAGQLKIITMLPAGVLVRIDRLMQDNGEGSQVWVIASLEDETNYPTTTNLYLNPEFLENNSFFGGPYTLHRWGVDSNYLEAVTHAP